MDWTTVVVFFAGLSIGTMFGVIISGLARAAKSGDIGICLSHRIGAHNP